MDAKTLAAVRRDMWDGCDNCHHLGWVVTYETDPRIVACECAVLEDDSAAVRAAGAFVAEAAIGGFECTMRAREKIRRAAFIISRMAGGVG
jgi:hypothetical protein